VSMDAIVEGGNWAEPGGREAAAVILRFLADIGVPVALGSAEGEGAVLPGLAFRQGTLIVDPATPAYPGDLLHEAGHYAVTEPEGRDALSDPGSDPAKEMAAMAWSAAAAMACGVPMDVLFHEHGYKGNAQNLAMQFGTGNGPGVPMLAWYGMTAEVHRGTPELPGYPVMQRWLR